MDLNFWKTRRSYSGEYRYERDEIGEIGRERFLITVEPDGSRTARAICEIDELGLGRDVIYTIGPDWKPRDAYVRIFEHGRFQGASFFRFADNETEMLGIDANLDRFEERRSVTAWPPVFAPHPVVCDGWQASQFNHSRSDRIQHLDNTTNSSPAHTGSGHPRIGVTQKNIEFVGCEPIEVPAGFFQAEHYRIHHLSYPWPPLEIWVTRQDRHLLKLRFELDRSSYFLTSIEGSIS